MGMSRADNSVKIWRNLPISNPKSDLHNINAHTKFGENPLMFTQVIIRKQKTDRRMDVRRMDGQTPVIFLGLRPASCMHNFARGRKKLASVSPVDS